MAASFRRYGPLAATAVAGFVLATGIGIALLRFSGFDWICLHQILCAVSDDTDRASQIHLSWVEDPATSLTVTWWLATSAAAFAEFRDADSKQWQRVESRAAPVPPNGIIGRRGAYHSATLSDLQSDTLYEYRVANGPGADEPTSAIYAARTAPAGRDAKFSFIFFSDTGLIMRPDNLSSGTAAIRDDIGGTAATFLLGGGDYAYGNADGRFVFPADAGDEWFRQWQPVLARLPLMAQYGNHEAFLREDLREWLPRFAHPAGYGDGRAYSFDVGSAHFTAMFAPGDGYLPPADLLAWLDDDLGAARERGATWLIVYQHDTLFGHGLSHPADPHLRRLLMPILERHGVDLHLAAQDQSYERTYPLTSGSDGAAAIGSTELGPYRAGDGVIYVKVSPAGKMSERTGDFSLLTEPPPPEIASRSDDGFHYAHVAVEGRSKLVVTILKMLPGETAPSVFERFAIVGGGDP